MFIDRAKVYIKAGDGGDGCQSFSKAKAQRYKRPDGGDGGKGGDVIIKTDNNIQTLVDFYYQKHFKAESGSNGSGNHKNGSGGRDLLINVPAGTIVSDSAEDVTYCDLSEIGRSVVIAKGGEGGKGNSRRRDATPGKDGEEKNILLRLKLVADVGIIGYPNVGKSSLISRISNAKSKVANYPFTTKTPTLGVVRLGHERSFVACDIPGLIEGAHSGRGLGDEFLRHIERTRLIVHMVDICPSTGNPLEDYQTICHELQQYSSELGDKPKLIVANKMDLTESDEHLTAFSKKLDTEVIPISAVTGKGLGPLQEKIWAKLEEMNQE